MPPGHAIPPPPTQAVIPVQPEIFERRQQPLMILDSPERWRMPPPREQDVSAIGQSLERDLEQVMDKQAAEEANKKRKRT